MIDTAWQLGGLDSYEPLNLRRWAHMLGFRGHFLTKSRATPRPSAPSAHERRIWRLRDDLDQLAADTDDPNDDRPVDLDTITVVNDWAPVHIGHRDHAERELAAGHRRTHTARNDGPHRPTPGGQHEHDRHQPYLTVAEAAAYLNTSVRFVRRLDR